MAAPLWKISYDAKRFHDAVNKSSRARSAKPMEEYWARAAMWWKDVVEGPGMHPGWPEVYRSYGRYEYGEDGQVLRSAGGTSFGSEFSRWERTYPVPPNHRRPPQLR